MDRSPFQIVSNRGRDTPARFYRRLLGSFVTFVVSGASFCFVGIDSSSGASNRQLDEKHSMLVGGLRIPEEPTLVLRDIGGCAAVFPPGDSRCEGDDIIYRIRSPSNDYLASGVVALIKAHAGKALGPMMPQLQASLDEIPSTLMVRWRFDVVYPRPNERDLPDDKVHIPATGFVQLQGGEPWKLFKEYGNVPFFGGNATLTFQICTADAKNCVPKDYHYRFRIGGQNPIEELATKYIDKAAVDLGAQRNMPVMWYASAVAKHETKYEGGVKPGRDRTKPAPYYHQFLQRGFKGDPKPEPNDPETYKPNWNFDGLKDDKTPMAGGFGILQVTGNSKDSDANVPRDVIWNWQKNADAGLRILAAKQKRAISWLEEQKRIEKNQPPIPPIVVRSDEKKHKGLEVIFDDKTSRTIADVVTIKGYNGSSRPKDPSWVDPGPEPEPKMFGYTGEHPRKGYYVYWCDKKHKWCLSRYNAWNPPRNYVSRVCLEVTQ